MTSPPRTPPAFELDGGKVDLDRRTVAVPGGVDVTLTAIETDLLRYLVANPDRTIPHRELLSEVWGYNEAVQTRTVYVTVDRLRKKIERDPKNPRHLIAVPRAGYRMEGVSLPQQPRTLPRRPHLLGRDQLVGIVTERLQLSRVVTLRGPPGIGKTTLALEVAWQLEHPVVWLEVGPQDSSSALLGMLQHQLGATTSDPQALFHARTVVVLNDAEAAPEAVGGFVRELLSVPDATVLATSWRPLQLAEEVLVDLPPLSPDDARGLYRARHPEGRRDGEVADRLEGVPLAIELAADTARLIGEDALLQRLTVSMDVLDAGTGVTSRSLNSAVESAWHALHPDEQNALTQLSVFTDAFGVDAAEAICPTAVPLLARLRDKSMVQVPEPGRFRIFEHIRTFARARVPDPAEVAGRHAEHVLSHANAVLEQGDSPDGPTLVERLGRMRNDLAAAFHWAGRHEPALAARGALAMSELLAAQGRTNENIAMLGEALDHVTDPVVENELVRRRAKALQDLGRNAEAMADYTRAIAHAEQHGLHDQLVFALGGNAIAQRNAGIKPMVHHAPALRKAMQRARQEGFPYAAARALEYLSRAHRESGDLDQAYEELLLASALLERSPSRKGEESIQVGLAELSFARGDHEQGLEAIERASHLATTPRHLAIIQQIGARMLLDLERADAAQALIEAAAPVFERALDPFRRGMSAYLGAWACLVRGELGAASGRFSRAERLFAAHGAQHWLGRAALFRGAVARLEGRQEDASACFRRATERLPDEETRPIIEATPSDLRDPSKERWLAIRIQGLS